MLYLVMSEGEDPGGYFLLEISENLQGWMDATLKMTQDINKLPKVMQVIAYLVHSK